MERRSFDRHRSTYALRDGFRNFFLYIPNLIFYGEREWIFFLARGEEISHRKRYVSVHWNTGGGKKDERGWNSYFARLQTRWFRSRERDLVDIDTIESYTRLLRSYESFLNASTKLTYIGSISINDKGGRKKRRETRDRAREFQPFLTILGGTWLDIREDSLSLSLCLSALCSPIIGTENGLLSTVTYKQ